MTYYRRVTGNQGHCSSVLYTVERLKCPSQLLIGVWRTWTTLVGYAVVTRWRMGSLWYQLTGTIATFYTGRNNWLCGILKKNKLIFPQVVLQFPSFRGTQRLIPCSKHPVTFPCREPDESNSTSRPVFVWQTLLPIFRCLGLSSH